VETLSLPRGTESRSATPAGPLPRQSPKRDALFRHVSWNVAALERSDNVADGGHAFAGLKRDYTRRAVFMQERGIRPVPHQPRWRVPVGMTPFPDLPSADPTCSLAGTREVLIELGRRRRRRMGANTHVRMIARSPCITGGILAVRRSVAPKGPGKLRCSQAGCKSGEFSKNGTKLPRPSLRSMAFQRSSFADISAGSTGLLR
jgi:hypothetical protein